MRTWAGWWRRLTPEHTGYSTSWRSGYRLWRARAASLNGTSRTASAARYTRPTTRHRRPLRSPGCCRAKSRAWRWARLRARVWQENFQRAPRSKASIEPRTARAPGAGARGESIEPRLARGYDRNRGSQRIREHRSVHRERRMGVGGHSRRERFARRYRGSGEGRRRDGDQPAVHDDWPGAQSGDRESEDAVDSRPRRRRAMYARAGAGDTGDHSHDELPGVQGSPAQLLPGKG